jgi:O-antigen/teichoic acid export membrane protein
MSIAAQKPASRSSSIVGNSAWMSLDTIVGLSCALMTSIAVARVLGPAKLGYYSYVLWLTNIAAALANYGIPAATGKYMAEYLGRGDAGTAAAIARRMFRWQFWLMLAVVTCGLAVVALRVPAEHRVWAGLAVLSLAPNMLIATPTQFNVALEKFRGNVIPSVISTVMNLVGVGLALWFRWELVGLSASLLLSRGVDFSIRYGFYRSGHQKLLREARGGEGVPPELQRKMLCFCMDALALQILNIAVWDRSEMIFLKQFSDMRQIAYYSTSFNITQQVLLIPQIFASAAGASLMVRVGSEPAAVGRMAGVMLRYSAILGLPLMFGLAALSSPAVRLLYGWQYTPAIPVLAVLALFAAAKGIMLPAQKLIMASDRQRSLVQLTLVIAVLNITLDLLLIPRGGAMGAAFANGIAQVVGSIALWVFAAQRLSAIIPIRTLSAVIASAGAMAGVVALTGFALRPLPAALIGIPLGALIYLVLLRLTSGLDASDRHRLSEIERSLPGRVQPFYRLTVHFLTA